MSAPDKLFAQLFNEYLNGLHTSMPCTVVKYYPDENKADIQPKFMSKKGGELLEYSLIKKAPVLKHVGELQEGDTVYVSFAERALDYIGKRRHDLTDAVIVGVM